MGLQADLSFFRKHGFELLGIPTLKQLCLHITQLTPNQLNHVYLTTNKPTFHTKLTTNTPTESCLT